MIQSSITMTSKGTFTLPVAIRKQLGVTKAGDKLLLTFHEKSQQVSITKPVDLASLRTELTAIVRAKGISPMSDQQLRVSREQAWQQ